MQIRITIKTLGIAKEMNDKEKQHMENTQKSVWHERSPLLGFDAICITTKTPIPVQTHIFYLADPKSPLVIRRIDKHIIKLWRIPSIV
jgi:hypothetical protein